MRFAVALMSIIFVSVGMAQEEAAKPAQEIELAPADGKIQPEVLPERLKENENPQPPQRIIKRWHVGPPNSGKSIVGDPTPIAVGNGEGIRLGPEKAGVQYGGGQILRYGTDRFGVRIGGGEGYRIGTPNIGVQYGGGQILRWGTPNAGVRVGGGEGVRIGTRGFGIQFGTGRGLQIGRIYP